MSDTLPKGYACECGVDHRFPAYVYAHWREELVHECDSCKRKHSICAGYVELIDDEVSDK